MSNIPVIKPVKNENEVGNIMVTNSVRKTHCIACNSAFLKPRAGKLYCSNRCKQFGYNHKEIRIVEIPQANERITQTKRRFRLEDYTYFIELVNDLKRYRELLKRFERFKDQQKTINIKTEMGLSVNQDQSFSYFSNQFNEQEFDELQVLDANFESLKNSDPPYLSFEQWSFFKSIYKRLDDDKLFKTICLFSKEYIQQLNLKSNENESLNEQLIIKKMYLKHCNEITTGLVQII